MNHFRSQTMYWPATVGVLLLAGTIDVAVWVLGYLAEASPGKSAVEATTFLIVAYIVLAALLMFGISRTLRRDSAVEYYNRRKIQEYSIAVLLALHILVPIYFVYERRISMAAHLAMAVLTWPLLFIVHHIDMIHLSWLTKINPSLLALGEYRDIVAEVIEHRPSHLTLDVAAIEKGLISMRISDYYTRKVQLHDISDNTYYVMCTASSIEKMHGLINMYGFYSKKGVRKVCGHPSEGKFIDKSLELLSSVGTTGKAPSSDESQLVLFVWIRYIEPEYIYRLGGITRWDCTCEDWTDEPNSLIEAILNES